MTGETLLLLAAQTAPTTVSPASRDLVVNTGLIALFVVVLMWPVVGPSVTVAHEGGHALLGLLFGRVGGVTINPNRSGLTVLAVGSWFGKVVSFLAGYLGPSLFGLLGAQLLARGQTQSVLLLTLVFLFMMLLIVRKLFGNFVVLATGAVVILVLRNATPEIQTAFTYTWIWVLLLGGLFSVFELRRDRAKGRRSGRPDTGSDAAQLASLTLVPGALWVLFFMLATVVALFLGAGLMLGSVKPLG